MSGNTALLESPKTDNMDMADAALALLARGFSVIPCHSPGMPLESLPPNLRKRVDPASPEYSERDVGKVPLVAWDDYQERLPKEREVRDWWTKWPGANPAIVTGEVSGVVVLDSDGHEATGYATQRGLWVGCTLGATTGREGGLHFFFRAPGEKVRTNFALAPGLDVKADGGYVIAPPSLHRLGLRYEWLDPDQEPMALPTWVLEAARSAARAKGEVLPSDELRRLMLGLGSGQRHDGAKVLSAHFFGVGWGYEQVRDYFLTWCNACQPKADFAHVMAEVDWVWEKERQKRRKPDDPDVARHGDDFLFDWPALGMRITLRRLHENNRGELQADVSVDSSSGENYHYARLVLMSTSGREDVDKKLRRIRGDVEWTRYLNIACRLTAEKFHAGLPGRELVPRKPAANQHLIRPLLPLGKPAVIFGDGGSGKSTLALVLALSAAHGFAIPGMEPPAARVPVLYLDWEAEGSDHEEYLWALLRGLGVEDPAGWEFMERSGLHYRPMLRPLADELPRLKAEAAKLGVGMVIVDSHGPAAGGDATPEGAIAFMAALRHFAPASQLVIAHVSKADAGREKGAMRPFGSVYLPNLARASWELIQEEGLPEDGFVRLSLLDRKRNRGRRRPPIGLRLEYQESRDEVLEAIRVLPDAVPDSLRTLFARVIDLARRGLDVSSSLAELGWENTEPNRAKVRAMLSKGRRRGLLPAAGD